MLRIIAIACLAIALQACARSSAVSPSHLGLPILSEDELSEMNADPAAADTALAELRHVTSNKVLGAMAFQKTTGRTVDPDRLRGRQ